MLTAQPGRFGRLTYDTGRQRQRVGTLLDMADPARVSDVALAYQRKYPGRALRLDVLAEDNWKAPVLQSFELKDYPNGLAGPAPTAQPVPAMSHDAATPTVLHPRTMEEAPPNLDAMGQFIFRQQANALHEARQEVLRLEEKLRNAKSDKKDLRKRLEAAELELKHKQREYEADLRDARRDIQDEFEQQAKPGGLGGLMEAATAPNSPLAGVLGMLATKLLGDGGAPAPAAGGRSANMTLILNGIAELLPDEQTAAQVYAALQRIIPHQDGIKMLLQLAGLEQPQPTE